MAQPYKVLIGFNPWSNTVYNNDPGNSPWPVIFLTDTGNPYSGYSVMNPYNLRCEGTSPAIGYQSMGFSLGSSIIDILESEGRLTFLTYSSQYTLYSTSAQSWGFGKSTPTSAADLAFAASQDAFTLSAFGGMGVYVAGDKVASTNLVPLTNIHYTPIEFVMELNADDTVTCLLIVNLKPTFRKKVSKASMSDPDFNTIWYRLRTYNTTTNMNTRGCGNGIVVSGGEYGTSISDFTWKRTTYLSTLEQDGWSRLGGGTLQDTLDQRVATAATPYNWSSTNDSPLSFQMNPSAILEDDQILFVSADIAGSYQDSTVENPGPNKLNIVIGDVEIEDTPELYDTHSYPRVFLEVNPETGEPWERSDLESVGLVIRAKE